MLRVSAIDFRKGWKEQLPLVEFSYNNIFQASIEMAPFEALYGGPCRSSLCWAEVGEKHITGPDLVAESNRNIKLIQKRLLVVHSRQKSYIDRRHREVSHEIGDHVFLKVSPIKGQSWFGLKRKLSPRFNGPFQITECVGSTTYHLELPPQLSKVHDVFHVSRMLRYTRDPSHIMRHETLKFEPDLSMEEEPTRILKIQECKP